MNARNARVKKIERQIKMIMKDKQTKMRETFINTIKSNNYRKSSKTLDVFFHHINETDECFSYKELIRRDLHTPEYAFGKYFKENGGIQKQIHRVYYYKESHKENTFQKCLLCDIQINDKMYSCYIETNYDEGCKSCGMGRYEDNTMYISHNLETLILICLSPTSFCFVV